MGVFQNNLLAASAAAASSGGTSFYDHQIEQSCRFEFGNDTTLNRTNSFSAITTFTFSTWFKRTTLGGEMGGLYAFVLKCDSNKGVGFTDTDKITTLNGTSHSIGSAVHRDTAGWGHLLLSVNSGTGTTFVNGVSQSSNSGMQLVGGADAETIGICNYGTNNFGGYLAETALIDGQALAYTSFAEFKNGVLIPKDFSGLTFGTQGFHLKYENASDLGNDSSGNNNDYTATGMAADHQVLDSPTIGTG
jgi:hypothetical protein